MIYTNLASLAYLVSSILQIIFTNKKEYEIALLYHDYYHDYIIAGVSIILDRFSSHVHVN